MSFEPVEPVGSFQPVGSFEPVGSFQPVGSFEPVDGLIQLGHFSQFSVI